MPAKSKATKDLSAVHSRALRRWDDTVNPQLEIREKALEARRFVTVPGAMWEGQFGDLFVNAIKPEINKVRRGVRKLENDYRQNRIVPDFRPDGPNANEDTAATLDGLFRADYYRYKCQQAVDNAVSEAAKGGFGAYRLLNVWEDADDPDNDYQRINPGGIIVDADQRVFFDGNSKYYDKHDARFAFVVTAMSRDAFDEEYPDKASDWPEGRLNRTYEWFTPDVVRIAEYYEVEKVKDTLLIFTLKISGEEQRFWKTQIEDEAIESLKSRGWTMREQVRPRRRVCKYTMSGAEVLSDDGYIAGTEIPVIPVYHTRDFIDNQERFTGHVQPNMDAARLYNAKVGRLAELDATQPRERPIFSPEQMPPELRELWARGEVDRHGYALALPLIDPITGQIAAAGPVGKIEPMQLPPVTAALLEVSNRDMIEDDEDSSDTAKANVSEEAMNLAATRIDAKSGPFLDNVRQSVQRAGEVYESMCADVYWEAGRAVSTMDEEGGDGEAILQEEYTDKRGRFGKRNDFTTGKYKVVVSVSEATTTRRDKAVRAALYTADIAAKVGDQDLARACVLTAVMNQDGEGMQDLKKYVRKAALAQGIVEPNDEEKAAMAQAEAQPEEPDAMTKLADAQAMAFQARAAKDMASLPKIAAETNLLKTKEKATAAGVMIEARKVESPALN